MARSPFIGALSAALAWAALAGPAVAQSRATVVALDVLWEVREDGTVLVTEQVSVRTPIAGYEAPVERVLMTALFREGSPRPVQLPLRVLSAARGGDPVNFWVRTWGGDLGWDGAKVRMGHGNTFLPDGTHRYTLVYETDRWTTFGPLSDEVQAIVRGTGSTGTIDEVRVRVRVEGLDAPLRARAMLRGAGAPTASDARWDPTAREVVAHAARPLGPDEALDVRVELPKWVVGAPSHMNETVWFWLDWGGWVEAALTLLLVCGVYVTLWYRVGRDRSGRAIVPQYEAPRGVSPAALGYLMKRGYAPRHFAAAVVSMAVKGALRIRREGRRWRLERGGGGGLTPDERATHAILFDGADALVLGLSEERRLRRAAAALRERLAAGIERTLFIANARWFLAGLAVSVLGYGVLAWRWRVAVPPGGWLLGPILSLWTALTSSVLLRSLQYLRHGRAAGEGRAIAWGGVALVLSAPIVGVWVSLVLTILEQVPTHLFAASVLLGLTNVVFYHLLQRPSVLGHELIDHGEGFRRFLVAVEEDRFSRLGSPAAASAAFERLLPYALALGVEGGWGSGFTAALTPPGGGRAAPYSPEWFSAAGDDTPTSSDFGDALGAALAGRGGGA